MLVKIAEDSTIKGFHRISNASKEAEMAVSDPSYTVVDDMEFVEHMSCYELVGSTAQLKATWETIRDALVVAMPITSPAPEIAKVTKAKEIDATFSAELGAITAGYSEDEIKSWDKQEAEAIAFTADPAAPTPLLSAMVAVRGDTVAALASKIVANSVAYTAAYGAFLGKKHAREMALSAVDLDAADAVAQVESI